MDLCVTKNNGDDTTTDANTLGSNSLGVAGEIGRQVVRVEANFLRLPLFALDTKHLRTMDGIRCEGTFSRLGKSYAFSFAATRNSATYYPGPLARSVHFALLELAQERGTPIQNPITFTWRELCGRMNVQPSGKMVSLLRDALTATKGLMIESRAALFSKSADAPISTDERTRVLSLYDELEFHGTVRPDGSLADANAVWLSAWYLDNLNALYSGPLDYGLWRDLNERSPIASRLYEFLFFKFYGGRDLLRFNYPTLVKFIPARTERYSSQAKKQLQPAFDLLIAAGVLREVQWVESRGGLPQLLLHRGPLLSSATAADSAFELGEEDFVLERIEDVKPPETLVVEAFHVAWGHGDFRPSRAELDLARDLIARHGLAEVEALVPKLVSRLKEKWSDAKTFNAVLRYLPDVLAQIERERTRVLREQQERTARAESRERSIRQAQDQAALQVLWDGLSPAEQTAIRDVVLARQPAAIQKFPAIVQRFCFEELAKRTRIGTGE